ncbi:MAG: hypothetical protein KA158_08430 [Leucobacter sp.]|nr:hypothetical protein [Leucobacter sp.]
MRKKNQSRFSRRASILGVAGLAGAGVAVALTATTMAALSDEANLNVGAAGVGSSHAFDIGVVVPGGTVEQADGDDGFDWEVPGAQELIPGHALTTEIPVFNNTPKLGAATSFRVVLRNGDGSVAPGTPNITPHLRFTAKVSGVEVFSDVAWEEARGSLGQLVARDAAPLSQGDAYVAGPAGSEERLELTIVYLDEAGVEELNGGQSALAVRFDAESVRL